MPFGNLGQVVTGNDRVERRLRLTLVDRQHVIDLRDASHVAAAQKDFLLAGLVAGDAEHRCDPARSVEGHRQPGDRQALSGDVGLDRLSCRAVQVVQARFRVVVDRRARHRVRSRLGVSGMK